MADKKPTRQGYGEGLAEFARTHEDIVALDADLAHATGSAAFLNEFPERFFNAGIAEQNMIGMASGLSRTGLVPFASSFAVFSAGRAFEIIRNGVCYPHNNVKFAFTHAGVTVGEDGGTHQAIEDIALMRVLPGMTVIVPCDANETYKAVEAAAAIDGPVYLRLARLATTVFDPMPFEVGKGNVMRDGKDAVIFACGLMVEQSLMAAELLKEQGKDVAVVNLHTIKPLDRELVARYADNIYRLLRENRCDFLFLRIDDYLYWEQIDEALGLEEQCGWPEPVGVYAVSYDGDEITFSSFDE